MPTSLPEPAFFLNPQQSTGTYQLAGKGRLPGTVEMAFAGSTLLTPASQQHNSELGKERIVTGNFSFVSGYPLGVAVVMPE